MVKKSAKLYIDIEQPSLNGASAVGFIGTDETGSPLNLIWAGKSLHPMPVSDKKEEAYGILADEYDVHFIFDDNVPKISFYPIPALRIFAHDSMGGCFASTHMAMDITEKDAPIYYIDKTFNTYKLSPNLLSFLEMLVFSPSWKTAPGLESPSKSGQAQPCDKVPDPSQAGRDYLIQSLHLQDSGNLPVPRQALSEEITIYPSLEHAKKEVQFYDITDIIEKHTEHKERNLDHMDNKNVTMLMILDGFGINPPKEDYDFSTPDPDYNGNAIRTAKTPCIDHLLATYPHTLIGASGENVGLPDGQMGNSEVGHLNLGAGRVVYQELTRITKHIKDGEFFKNTALQNAMDHVLETGGALHLFGLLSDGGVHSHDTHLYALLDFAKQKGIQKIYVHALLDGRDVPPKSAEKYFVNLEAHITSIGTGKIATIAGRYYGMDRDNRWERVVQAYDAISIGKGAAANATSALGALEAAYTRGESDEFVLPTVIVDDNDRPIGTVSDGDSFIMFNFRPDRAREITRCFVDPAFSGFDRTLSYQNLHYVCMTQYDKTMPNVHVAFPPQSLDNTLGEYLSELGKTQLRIAETEKYAHVTFFFNGGVEEPNAGEDRLLIPSPKVDTYDQKPEMSAYEVTEAVLEQIRQNKYDVIILNYANPDMVGHTGSMEAAVKAIEAVDTCVGRVAEAVLAAGGQILLTADHGNADVMIDEDGGPMTAHSLNPTPLIVISEQKPSIKTGGVLADIAPTMLALMDLPIPPDMTGKSLI